ncbi:hypothetical protein WA026_003494 [Henosepilachna vigintioctopunctata]|uniref:Uncharacterized protein n=1 Tax=Henosepilachna vigintioctopunctata TaxID=420089 RepID=A0AAW1TP01_9CUCU
MHGIIFCSYLAFLLGSVIGAPQEGPTTEPIAILRQEQEVNFDGSYKFSFESADGTKRTENGKILDTGDLAVDGTYEYLSPNNMAVKVDYTSGPNGFIPKVTIQKIAEAPPLSISPKLQDQGLILRISSSAIASLSG